MVSQVAIMVRANEKWAAAGMPKNDANRFWSEAEQELRREAAKQMEQHGKQSGSVLFREPPGQFIG